MIQPFAGVTSRCNWPHEITNAEEVEASINSEVGSTNDVVQSFPSTLVPAPTSVHLPEVMLVSVEDDNGAMAVVLVSRYALVATSSDPILCSQSAGRVIVWAALFIKQ